MADPVNTSDDEFEKPVTLYKTFSICPRCALLEEYSAFSLKPAEVVKKFVKIWLCVNCNLHGDQETLLCGNAPWFEKMWQLSGVEMNEASITDIEDLKKKKRVRPASVPLIVELSVFNNDEFVTTEDIDNQLQKIKLSYPKGCEYIIKISGKLSNDMDILNNLIQYVQSKTTSRIIVSVSFERLVILSKLEDTCFLKPRIYPSVKYFMRKGEEKIALDELMQAFAPMKEFTDMKMLVSIYLEKPLPDLSSLIAFLRLQKRFIKVVELVIERSPKNIFSGLTSLNLQEIPPEILYQIKTEGKNVYTESVDPYLVLKHIEEATNKTISVEDFFPMSMASAVEPFLPMLGIGSYVIRPSPMCGFVCCLVNTKNYFSFPGNKIVNFPKLFKGLTPLLPKLEDEIGLFTMAQLKSVIDESAQPGVKLPSLLPFLTSSEGIEKAHKFIDNLQLIVVHNHMDVSTIDMVRRCQCTVLSKNSDSSGYVASCAGCL